MSHFLARPAQVAQPQYTKRRGRHCAEFPSSCRDHNQATPCQILFHQKMLPDTQKLVVRTHYFAGIVAAISFTVEGRRAAGSRRDERM
ncbi:hypothetical protein IE4872_PC00363 (plasmid) [Rhizobium gallicum]|uniref:Uncharacterized protein n=1 Tax=Rhizobium gallicum TaxID=56730 RepID=A0A1L5NR84_9HYPH|nr:hypothetical protein IE4872_PC00363 [Rhizobium gallicum]